MEILIYSILFVLAVVGYMMLGVIEEWFSDWVDRRFESISDWIKGIRIKRQMKKEKEGKGGR